ncbi:MAG: hypothetical protein IT462_09195 [Planctomycetes bacterium]|nr:hypothetical protein [Planctomycetota bacterium]
MWELEKDKRMLETFRKLGITLGKATVYPPGKGPRIPFTEATTQSLLLWCRMLGEKTPPKLLEELRRRKAIPEQDSGRNRRRKAG